MRTSLGAMPIVVAILLALVSAPPRASAQGFTTPDSTIRQIWVEGMERSQTYPLAQALMDSIGPRLTGSPALQASHDWLLARYRSWGIPAHNERYGTWRGWRPGITHVDLLAPRVRTLNGTLLEYSPGTGGKNVMARVVILPEVRDSAAFVAWLPQAKGKFVLVDAPFMTCRPNKNWERFATPESFARMKEERDLAERQWEARIQATGSAGVEALSRRLDTAGVAGVISTSGSGGWGRMLITPASIERVPSLRLSCEDYGLIFRLAERNQGPQLRLRAEAKSLGEIPVFNTIAQIRGVEKPNEYVILSAHLDSGEGASGATENGTGTIAMLEAMRILKTVYPRPKRTILVGHWTGENQGMNGSHAFVADHPEIAKGVQVVYNHHGGTGRAGQLSAGGLIGGSGYLARWVAHLPEAISKHLILSFPGPVGSSDNSPFRCHGALAVRLGAGYGDQAPHWEWQYTTNTNLDTFDKIVFDDLKHNVTLTAMLAYLAAEDPGFVPRDRRIFTPGAQGGDSWPECQPVVRSSAQSTH